MSQSLGFFVKKAREQNPELQAVQVDYSAALEKVPQVEQLVNPTLGIGVPLLAPETRLGAQILTLSAQQLFPWFGTQKAKKEVVLNQAKSKYEQITMARLNLDFEVKKAYYTIYHMNQKQALIKKNSTLLNALEKIVLDRVANGTSLASDALRIQLELETLSKEIEILEQEKKVFEAHLNAKINVPLDTPIEIDSFKLEVIKPVTYWYLLTEKVNTHPLLNQLDWQIKTSSANIYLNTLEGKPQFGLGLDYSIINPRTDALPTYNGRDILIPKLTFSIPLYRKKIRAKKQEEELKQKSFNLQKEQMRNRLLTNLKKHITTYENALLRHELYEKKLTIAQSAYRILLTAYSSEGNRFEELLALQTTLNQYELNQLDALIESHLAKIGIERITNF